jgi:two-component system nitrate/nitrite response regulator NarL
MKLLIVDDHAILREGLAAWLGHAASETIVLRAVNADEAFALADLHSDIDLVLLDLFLPGTSGFPAISEFGRRWPDLPVLVLSSSEDQRDVRKAFALGALGYVPKSASGDTLLAAIKLVLDGELYVPTLLLDNVNASATPSSPFQGRNSGTRLTERQIEVLRRLNEGESNKAVALALNLSEKTVKAHITAIFRALDVINRTQAVNVARRQGLI